ncbi:hypothetical protein [Tuwongella immobilis]|uniref:Uncharacterized protein n=1 Tax=Tuwongella immobilis TaxID=692036 RepID=A0A6C2YVP8_9BACT|nr:hypothetical protein [Tuwongella immobilis]VIP04942.1 unnamed protein product [Tuwongella immobilis]VTS07242.1 unnamed protein product [Tuwongella immobilis]
MTFFGKLLVGLIFASSMMALTLATSVYTQFVPLKPNPARGGEEWKNTRLTKLEDKIKTLNRAGYRAKYSWTAANTKLTALEKERPARQAFYASQLELVQSGSYTDANGQKKAVAEPVQELVLDPSGNLDISKLEGRAPIKESPTGASLVAVDAYRSQLDRIAGEIKDSQLKEKDLIEKHQMLTNELIDVADKKGLRTLLREQQDLLVRINDEIDYLRPSLTNGLAETQLLLKRKNSLTNRLNELKAYRGELSLNTGKNTPR